MVNIIYFLTGSAIGFFIALLFFRTKQSAPQSNNSEELATLDKQNAVLQQQLSDERKIRAEIQQEINIVHEKLQSISVQKAESDTRYTLLSEKLKDQRNELDQLHQQMREQFKNIAADILQKSSQTVQDEHRNRLNDILSPLKDKIEKFETQVGKTNEERIREHQSLKEQISQLHTLNKTIGDEAHNLVSALKGQSKTQGNWGELILEKVLESSGLVKGREYNVQASMNNEEGRRLQPDIIINLPEQRTLVVDSKLSLISYERYCNCSDETQRDLHLKEHIGSIRRHIRDLSGKNYQHLYSINTLDFVLLFVPVEPAFALAVEHDAELFNEAFGKNIVVVTTSTLLATLRTIASIWRLEYQNKNSQEIARQSAELYDKFAGLIDDLIQVGTRMNDAEKAYSGAMAKLHTGRGNLVARVENLKKLGLKTSKQINPKLLQRTEDLIESDEVAE